MSELGLMMEKEILQIPEMITKLSSSDVYTSECAELLSRHSISSVVIVARGTSDNAAHFLKFLIETELGLPCGLASPSATSLYQSNYKYRGTLVIAISQSGQSTDLNLFTDSAKRDGAYILAITNDEKSPLAMKAHLHIPLLAGPENAVPATKSYVGQLFVSYLLISQWMGKKPMSEKVLSEIKNLLARREEAKNFASSLEIDRPIAVLGRGFSYPNAKEFALKIQETCLVPVQGMSTSDYLHGPIAALYPETQVIFMAPTSQPGNSFGDAINRVRESTTKVFWIGRPDQILAGETTIHGSTIGDEVLENICDAVAFQLITLELARGNGLNPDSPRGLSKVTKTL